MIRALDEMREAAEERALVRRARAGDRDAYDRLVAERFHDVYAFLHRLTGSHEDAEDLAQECFVRAWRALSHYREEAAFSTWLARIALHLAQDHHRSRERRANDIGLATVEGRDTEPAAGGATAPPDLAHRRELVRVVALAMRRLPPRLRAAIVLRALEGREYDEVGQVLGVRAATARTQVMKARRILLRALAPWLAEGGPP